MSLATRCTSCGTVFRVVQDQLKVSEGWVRCGRCNEVFNALEGLFDLERDPPAEWSPAASKPTSAPATPAAAAEAASEAEPAVFDDPSLVDKIDAQLLSPRRSGFGALSTLAPMERRHEDFADARFDTDLPPEPGVDLSIGAPSTAPAEPEHVASDTPEFVRRAESEEQWRGSPARAWLVGACLLLAGTLTVQAGHHFRDRIAAQWPMLRPALMAWCGLAACRLEAPRRIDDVSVESTALTRATPPDAFQLSVVLRNRAPLAVSVPWIELSLTDAGGRLVARRALAPADFEAATASLAAGAELPMQLTLSAAGGRVAGYTVEVFYP